MIRDTVTDGEDAAFPHHIGTNNSPESGLSKREWFAGMALQGLLAGDTCNRYEMSEVAEIAVNAAATLIERLNPEAGQ